MIMDKIDSEKHMICLMVIDYVFDELAKNHYLNASERKTYLKFQKREHLICSETSQIRISFLQLGKAVDKAKRGKHLSTEIDGQDVCEEGEGLECEICTYIDTGELLINKINRRGVKMELERKILEMIVERAELEDVDFEGVNYDAPIFASFDEAEEGLQLDSVDALELVVGLNELFGIKVSDEDMAIFRSITTLADYVREQQATE